MLSLGLNAEWAAMPTTQISQGNSPAKKKNEINATPRNASIHHRNASIPHAQRVRTETQRITTVDAEKFSKKGMQGYTTIADDLENAMSPG
jgi:hypothetical protein